MSNLSPLARHSSNLFGPRDEDLEYWIRAFQKGQQNVFKKHTVKDKKLLECFYASPGIKHLIN